MHSLQVLNVLSASACVVHKALHAFSRRMPSPTDYIYSLGPFPVLSILDTTHT